MNSVVLLLSALLTFASWVDAATTFPKEKKCTEQTYSGGSGTIDFPGGGKNYENGLNCLFTINVAEDHFVQFSFSQFDFELGEKTTFFPDGCYDWLKFIDGTEESCDTTRFCGKGPDPLSKKFSSKKNTIILWMSSDHGMNGKGFKLNWTAIKKEPVEQDCECNADGTESQTDCGEETEKCNCKTGYTGAKCEQCTEGYWNSTDSTTKCEECEKCECNKNQIGSCNISNGKCICTCKAGYEGKDCNDCEENYWLSSGECKACDVCGCKGNKIGSCDKTNGKCVCKCKAGYKGDKCDECVEDYWMSSSECKKCETCDKKCEENQTGSCDKSNGKCKCSSAATFAFDKTIVLFTAFLIFFSHKF